MTNNHDDLSNRLRRGLDHGRAPDLSLEIVTGASGRPQPRLANRANTFQIAGGAGLAIAAITVGALVIVPSLAPRAPLFTASSAGSAANALGSQEASSSDLKIGWWVDYRYSAAASLSTAGGSGQVYRLVLDGTDPAARTASLAATLGVDGAPAEAEFSDAAYPTWVVGPQDGTGTSLSYSAYGTGDWWFNDPAAASFYLCDTSVTVEDAASFGCILPADAPVNLAPTGGEARSLAAALFASTGYPVTAADIEIISEDWGTTATAYLSVDGARTALGWGASWSNTGGLSYAYGHSVTVESSGTFGTVSPAAAVDRLADGRWYGSAGPDFQGGAIAFASDLARNGVAGGVDAGVATKDATGQATNGGLVEQVDPVDPNVPTDNSVDPTAPETPAPSDPTDTPVDPTEPTAPAEPLPPIQVEPTPEVVNVTVDNATPTLLLLWDVDGNAWLVPGYAMQTGEGWWNAVVSLVDGVIALPEPMQIEPAILEPGVIEPGIIEPEVIEKKVTP